MIRQGTASGLSSYAFALTGPLDRMPLISEDEINTAIEQNLKPFARRLLLGYGPVSLFPISKRVPNASHRGYYSVSEGCYPGQRIQRPTIHIHAQHVEFGLVGGWNSSLIGVLWQNGAC